MELVEIYRYISSFTLYEYRYTDSRPGRATLPSWYRHTDTPTPPIYRVENCESEMMTAELAPLPADVADRVAQWATSNWNPRCISPKRLLYDLLAHYLDLTEDTIRGMIGRAEEKESATAS